MGVLKTVRCVERFRHLQRYDGEIDGAATNISDPYDAPTFLWVVG